MEGCDSPHAGTSWWRETSPVPNVQPVSSTFDPNAAAPPGSGIFGLPTTPSESLVHVLPVPFDATTSYRKGAARGPEAVLRASRQVDLFDLAYARPYEAGIALLEVDPDIPRWNAEATALAQPIIDRGGADPGDATAQRALARVNELCAALNTRVAALAGRSIAEGKLVALLGGDHSVPFGAFAAAAARWPGLGLLHVDAHSDLRLAYEGFEWSHASILRNAMERLPGIARLVQVGIRDLCEEEFEWLASHADRAGALFDRELAECRAEGGSVRSLVRRAIAPLPDNVWITFDVDGLDPMLCPNTGTPVPGGLSWGEALLLLDEVVRSGRSIVGFDLNEVSPGLADAEDHDSWDAVVGARLLYKLIGASLATRRSGAAT